MISTPRLTLSREEWIRRVCAAKEEIGLWTSQYTRVMTALHTWGYLGFSLLEPDFTFEGAE